MEAISRRHFLKKTAKTAAGISLFPPSLFSPLFRDNKIAQPIHRKAFAMGSVVSIFAYHPDTTFCHRAITKAFTAFQQYEEQLSIFKPDSEITKINTKAGKSTVKVSPHVFEILQFSQKISKETNGTFDITVSPLKSLWGFHESTNNMSYPSDKAIHDTLKAVGYNNIYFDEKHLKVGLLNKNSRIDLGGVGIGYAVDKAAEILRNTGVQSALINHSGDIYAIGAPLNKQGWQIGITNPQKLDTIIKTVTIRDEALCTSGNYRNFVKIGSDKIGHIFNPKTGIPAQAFLSTTVIAPKCIEADAYSTSCFVEQNKKIKDRCEIIAVVFNEDNGEIITKQ